MSSRLVQLLGLAVVAGALGWIGRAMIFGIFMLYDDEGYVLISLRDYGRHGGLYDQVFSQYGPAFFVAYDTLRRVFDFEWSNTTGRLLTLANWLGTAGFATLLLYRLRQSWPVLLYALVSMFTYTWIMIREPSHPGSLVTLVVSITAWVGWEALRAQRMDLFALFVGAMGAFLALVKINVGVFLILAAVYWLALAYRGPHSGRVVLICAGVAWLLCVALMRTLIAEGWVQIYLGVAGLGITGTVLAVASTAREHEVRWRHWVGFAVGGLAVTAISALVVTSRGTSWPVLIEGVFIAPLRHPTVYTFPVLWRPGVVLVGIIAVTLVALCLKRPNDGRLRLVVAWLRIITFALFQLTLLPWFSTAQAALGLCYGLPLAGLFVLPLSSACPAPVRTARAWIALLFVFQSLQAYPVAGSQISWGTWLSVPLMLLGLTEAVEYVATHWSARARSSIRVAVVVATLGFSALMLHTLYTIAQHYEKYSAPLALPGAEKVGLPASITASIQVMAQNAGAHSDVLLGLPGVFSFNLWTGVDTPTRANVTHWFSLLDDSRQQEIIDRMQATPRSALIVQQDILKGLVQSGFGPRGLLMEYLQRTHHRVLAVGTYSYWVKRERTIAPLSTAAIHRVAPGEGTPKLTVTLAAGHQRQAARLVVLDLSTTPVVIAQLDPTAISRTSFTPLDLAGHPVGPTQELTWPLSLEQLGRLEIESEQLQTIPEKNDLQVVLIAPEGHVVGTALLLRPDQIQPRIDPSPVPTPAQQP